MKVYLCLFGCYRTFQTTSLTLFTHLINNNTNCTFDIYINTEYCNIYNNEKWGNKINSCKYNKEELNNYFKKCYGSYLKNITYFTITKKYDNGSPYVQRIRNSINELDTDNNYDLYLFMRIDCVLSKKINVHEYTNKLNNNIVKYICRDVQRGECARKDHDRDWDMGIVSKNIDNIRKLMNGDFHHLPPPNDNELKLMMNLINCNNDLNHGIVSNIEEYKNGWWYKYNCNVYSFNKNVAPLWYEDDFYLSIIR